MSKTYGYARCSTSEDKQDINRQVRELKASGAEEVIFEYEHGDATPTPKIARRIGSLLGFDWTLFYPEEKEERKNA